MEISQRERMKAKMRYPVAWQLAAAVTLVIPATVPAAAQEEEAVSALALEALSTSFADTALANLGSRFRREILLLVPDLTADQRRSLDLAIDAAFAESLVRDDVARALLERMGSEELADWVERHPQTLVGDEWSGPAEGTVPRVDLGDELTAAERERLQLLVTLTEARGKSEFRLLIDEALGRGAHDLVRALGGGPAPFEPLSDEDFDAAYRRESLAQAVRSLEAHQAVPDSALRRSLTAFRSPEGQSFVVALTTATVAAVGAATVRMAELTVPEEPTAEEEAEEWQGLPCRGHPCGFVVDWTGPIPGGSNRAFGAPHEIETRVLGHLIEIGYRVERGTVSDGMTIILRPRLEAGTCEMVTARYDRICAAIGEVRVEFRGMPPGHSQPDNFRVRNRCGAKGMMNVRGISAMVAIHLDLALTTYPGDEREPPNC